MDKQTFEDIIASYGAEPRHWPEDKKSALYDYISANPTIAQAILSHEAELDRLLTHAKLPEMQALNKRIEQDMHHFFAATPINLTPRQTPWRSYLTAATAMAACMALSIFSTPYLLDSFFSPAQAFDIAALAGIELWIN